MTDRTHAPAPRRRWTGPLLALALGTLAFAVGRWSQALDARAATPGPAPAAGQVALPGGASVAFAEAAAPRLSPPLSYADIVAPALEAVVSVEAEIDLSGSPHGRVPDAFRWLLPGPRDEGSEPRAPDLESEGSGVIVRSDGIIVTNNHVVARARSVRVRLHDGRELAARVVGTDPPTDLAVLQVEARNLAVLPTGRSSSLRVGDVVFAVGNPFSIGETVTMGIVSALNRGGFGITQYDNFIQTDAAINPGNSGGALVSSRGELVGINTAIVSRGERVNVGIGLAVPIDVAALITDQILAEGKVTRAQIGIAIQPVTPALARALGLDGAKGVLVDGVMEGSAGARAGLVAGDVIVELDGRPIESYTQFRLDVAAKKPGTKVVLGVVREGSQRDVRVTLEELDGGEEGRSAEPDDDEGASGWGLSARDLTPEDRDQLDLPSSVAGAVITQVRSGTPAARAGLRRGDVVVQANRQPVRDAADLRARARAGDRDTLLLRVRREGTETFFVLERS
jgi:serine protease Do